MRRRLEQEDGFTLPEVIVAMAMMAAVLLALYAMFDASVRVFGAGSDRMEAVQDARQGLARMEREIRASYPRDKANGNDTLLTDFGQDHLVFGNDTGEDDDAGEDLGGNRRTRVPATGAFEAGERISYRLNAAGVPVRNGVRMVRHAEDVDGDGRALTFEYLDAQGGPVAGGDEGGVALVKIELEISVDGAGQRPVERTLGTAVALRNR